MSRRARISVGALARPRRVCHPGVSDRRTRSTTSSSSTPPLGTSKASTSMPEALGEAGAPLRVRHGGGPTTPRRWRGRRRMNAQATRPGRTAVRRRGRTRATPTWSVSVIASGAGSGCSSAQSSYRWLAVGVGKPPTVLVVGTVCPKALTCGHVTSADRSRDVRTWLNRSASEEGGCSSPALQRSRAASIWRSGDHHGPCPSGTCDGLGRDGLSTATEGPFGYTWTMMKSNALSAAPSCMSETRPVPKGALHRLVCRG